jgi:hypothetical protein
MVDKNRTNEKKKCKREGKTMMALLSSTKLPNPQSLQCKNSSEGHCLYTTGTLKKCSPFPVTQNHFSFIANLY